MLAGIPASALANTGAPSVTKCARVLVNSPGGGGPADVYAAELP